MGHGFHGCFFLCNESQNRQAVKGVNAAKLGPRPGTGQSRRAEELRRSGAGAIAEPSHRTPQCAL